jgi:small subunit ribosomal protein S20
LNSGPHSDKPDPNRINQSFGVKESIQMANTRSSAKRARQALKRNSNNQIVRSATRSHVRGAVTSILAKDVAKAKAAYEAAVRALSKAASKGSIPKGRASRKISRLTLLLKRSLPEALQSAKK